MTCAIRGLSRSNVLLLPGSFFADNPAFAVSQPLTDAQNYPKRLCRLKIQLSGLQ
ncbi:hypothetical protein [Leptothermofonsia sp. ETS-13]|uniref:hypothetical protein n=1 Tax=Leptothermofonsia sp. ETS-13 TaxID=3035696 RepID=UPI003BA22324